MKNLMSDKARNWLRGWSIDFIDDQFIPNHKGYDDHNLWFANCCTGAGKSDCGFECMMEDIANCDADGKKSLNGLVVPTIMLAYQTVDGVNNYASDKYPALRPNIKIMVKHSAPRNDPKNGIVDEKIDIDNKTNTSYLFAEGEPSHIIVVFVADSFFGSTKSASDLKTNLNWFRNSVADGKEMGNDVVSGCLIFDEAHNYKTKWEEITGYDVYDVNDFAPNKEKCADSVRMTFMDTILMTGTPCQKQCYLSQSDDFRPYTKEVNYAMALGIFGKPHEPWIICPSLWVIRTFTDDLKELENAIISAYLHEEILNQGDPSKANSNIHMLVNCKDIISAHDMGIHIYETMKNILHRDVDVIVLHSDKILAEIEENENRKLPSMLNGVEISADKAKKLVKAIDENYVERNVIVLQVGMISEGINVNSFNAIILTSCAEVKVVQQTGRGVRFLSKKYGTKNHTSIYAIAPNKSVVEEVVCKQLIEQGLDLSKVLMGVADLTKERPDGGGEKPEGGEFQSNGWTWLDFEPADIVAIEQKIQNLDWDTEVKTGCSNPDSDILALVEFAKQFMQVKNGGSGKQKKGGSTKGNGGSGNKNNNGNANTNNTPKPKKNSWTPRIFKNQIMTDLKKKYDNSEIVQKMCNAAMAGDVDALPWLLANFFMIGELPEIKGKAKTYLRGIVGKAITEND